jgi:hypothetical protein
VIFKYVPVSDAGAIALSRKVCLRAALLRASRLSLVDERTKDCLGSCLKRVNFTVGARHTSLAANNDAISTENSDTRSLIVLSVC